MVATRGSAGKHIDVELSDNGKELQKVIPIEKQRQLQMKQHQSSPKKETRGRKKKDRNLDELGTSVNSSESSSSSPSIKSHPRSPLTDAAAAPAPVKRTETRGRKRKIHDATDATLQQQQQHHHHHRQFDEQQQNRKKPHMTENLSDNNILSGFQTVALQQTHSATSVSPVGSTNNVVADKHKINHLLTSDSPPPPPVAIVDNTYSSSFTLPQKSLPPTNLITLPAPQLLNNPIPLRPVLPTPRTSSISTAANTTNMPPLVSTNSVALSDSSSTSPASSVSFPNATGVAMSVSEGEEGNDTVTSGQIQLNTITKHSNGRIPITSIISQKIDLQDIPLLLDDDGNSSNNENKKTKRRYRVDRDNIKINKRIMSQDTEDVIRMFKKFDDEVLTNPEARSRLLNLGFETRKRYITTFKHYIRFCCKKKLDHFFVTGELMREFYEEQFALSSSNKPVIRLRKMDPAFSKLQEINFLVYHLENKDIPNRQLALEYLVYKELGQEPPPLKRENYIPSPVFPKTVAPPLATGSPTTIAHNLSKLEDEKQQQQQQRVDSPIVGSEINTPQRPLTARVPQTAPPSLAVLQQPFDQGKDGLLVKIRDMQDLQHVSTSSSAKIDGISGKKKKHKHESKKHQKQKRSNTSSEDTLSSDYNNNNNNNNKKNKSNDLESSFNKLKMDIQNTLRQHVSADPAFISNLATCINQALEEFERANNLQPNLELNNNGIPIIDLNNKIYTVYEIIEEWYKIEPCIADRLKKWGESWIRDSIDHNTFLERKSVVEFVEKMGKELNVDILTIANDCDRYIHDKSILQEFIAEIDLDVDDLFKKVLRYRQRRN